MQCLARTVPREDSPLEQVHVQPALDAGDCQGGARRPRMLEKIGVELTTAGPVKARRLRQRAQLILDLLTPREQSPITS